MIMFPASAWHSAWPGAQRARRRKPLQQRRRGLYLLDQNMLELRLDYAVPRQ